VHARMGQLDYFLMSVAGDRAVVQVWRLYVELVGW
jgi:hypothetical protein